MENEYRTHRCGEITKECLKKKVKVAGWVNSIRDHGGITFIDLRDQNGLVQVVVNDDKKLARVSREAVIAVEGTVRNRGADNINPKLATGEVEIEASTVDVLGAVCSPLPFDVEDSKNIREDVRLKYRFLDLRNPALYNNIIFRSKVNAFLRKEMTDLGFIEISTPILTASSPEGARDFIVPARQHPGKFYALPQAPQTFKQLLMVGGFDRYFQIAPCFRDEDARADRAAGEFYQLDMELAFATQEDVIAVGEKVYYNLFTTFGKKKVSPAPFRRITFAESMEKYGSDKPDLRNPLIIIDVTKVFENTNFNAFKNSTVKAICVDNLAGQPRSFYDNLTNYMVEAGSKGLAWIKVESADIKTASSEKDSSNTAPTLNIAGQKIILNSPIAKFLSETEQKALAEKLNAKVGSSIFLLAGKSAPTTKLAGILRNELGARLNLCDPNKFELCWIVDFPMFELGDNNKIDFAHNPFTKPQGGLKALNEKAPLEVPAYQFDFVCNGIELLSGGERNTDIEAMVKAFAIAGYPESEVEKRFPALYNAFRYGVPPHAGMALGIDRSIMMLLDEPNVREVIAFPLNKSAFDPLMSAPNVITDKQLEEAHIKIDIKE